MLMMLFLGTSRWDESNEKSDERMKGRRTETQRQKYLIPLELEMKVSGERISEWLKNGL